MTCQVTKKLREDLSDPELQDSTIIQAEQDVLRVLEESGLNHDERGRVLSKVRLILDGEHLTHLREVEASKRRSAVCPTHDGALLAVQ